MAEKKMNGQFYLYGGVLLIGVLFIFYLGTGPLEVEKLDIKFEVGDSLGITSGSDVLNFGRVLPGMTVSKVVTLEGDYTYPVRIDILISSNIRDFVFSESSILMLPGENIQIPIELSIPGEITHGKYSGQVRFELWKIKE
jgi:hypothetical protein